MLCRWKNARSELCGRKRSDAPGSRPFDLEEVRTLEADDAQEVGEEVHVGVRSASLAAGAGRPPGRNGPATQRWLTSKRGEMPAIAGGSSASTVRRSRLSREAKEPMKLPQ